MKPLKLRSMLFVPADSERKLTKSVDNPADVLMDIPSSSAVPAATDTVYALEAEAGIGVGLLFC